MNGYRNTDSDSTFVILCTFAGARSFIGTQNSNLVCHVKPVLKLYLGSIGESPYTSLQLFINWQ